MTPANKTDCRYWQPIKFSASPILPFSDGGEGEKGADGVMASDGRKPG